MDLSDFNDALDRFGGDVARWPAALRGPAAALLAADPAARALLEEVQGLERGLRGPAAPGRSSTLIAAGASRHRQVRPALRQVRRTAFAASLAAALALGVLAGGLLPETGDPAGLAAAALAAPADIVDVD